MPIPALDTEELLQTLKHSSIPTLVVEGPTDARVYRYLERLLAVPGADVLHCGGRDTLLAVFRRRAEVRNTKLAFLADRDMYIFTSVPSEYDGVIWTTGYSIENDVYDGSDIERLLDESERRQHTALIDQLAKWFAFEVHEYLSGREAVLDFHVNVIVTPDCNSLHPRLVACRRYADAPAAIHDVIRASYAEKLRGKQLFDGLLWFLSAKNRSSKYSRANLLELCAKTKGHAKLDRLVSEARAAIT